MTKPTAEQIERAEQFREKCIADGTWLQMTIIEMLAVFAQAESPEPAETKAEHVCKPSCHNPCLLDERNPWKREPAAPVSPPETDWEWWFNFSATERKSRIAEIRQREAQSLPAQTVNELVAAAEQLLAWQPQCSRGSSGDLRQKRLRAAIDNFGSSLPPILWNEHAKN